MACAAETNGVMSLRKGCTNMSFRSVSSEPGGNTLSLRRTERQAFQALVKKIDDTDIDIENEDMAR